MRWRLIPDSLAARTMTVMVAGLTLSHLVSLGAYWVDLLAQTDTAVEQQVADRIASVRSTVAATPSYERERTAHLLSTPTLAVHWSRIPLVHAAETPEPGLADLRERLLELAPDQRGLPLRVSYDPEDGAGHRESTAHMILVSAQMSDGGWLNLRYSILDVSPHTPQGLMASTLLMALAVLSLSAVLVRSATGPLRAMATAAERLGVDVTAPPLPEKGPAEVRQAAHAFNEMQARIQRLLTDRTQMLAAISHDLRTPLTVLRLHAEFVEDEEQHAKMLGTIGEMEAMIASTLAFLRDDAAHSLTEVVDLAATLGTICDMLTDAGHTAEFAGTEHAPLRCRPMALKRALGNLVENAVKYGGRANVRLTTEDRLLRIVVADEGPGIPEQEMEKVFSPFYRGDASRSQEIGGFGLGLTIARSTIRAHGGDICLKNLPEGGLCVTVELPKVPS